MNNNCSSHAGRANIKDSFIGFGTMNFAEMAKNFGPMGRGTNRRPKYHVPMNIIETADHYEVSVYATGFSKDSIRLPVKDGVLHITGAQELKSEEPNFMRQEFPIKNFERTVSLNGAVNSNEISAEYQETILYIILPKTEEAKSVRLDLEVA